MKKNLLLKNLPSMNKLRSNFLKSLHSNLFKTKKNSFSDFPLKNQKVVLVLYEGGESGKKNKNILGCVENALGLREYLESQGHRLVVTSSKEAPNSVLDKEIADANVVISQPFWPAYITKERISRSPNLRLAITAGVGSDHVDLAEACNKNITVAEITGSNVVSVAEHVVMQILALVRNYIPAYHMVREGEWDIAKIADKAYDLEGKTVGTVGVGRIGHRVLQRLVPFDVNLHYYDPFLQLSSEEEKKLNVTRHTNLESMLKVCDVVTINCPLHPETQNLFNVKVLNQMKKGAYLVNTARGKIVNTHDLVNAVERGQIEGYAGDVWFPQPASRDHPWRQMPRHALTPHYSGTTLDAQKRYAEGVREVLDNYFHGRPQRKEYLIADGGKIVSPAYVQGNTTDGAK